MKIGIGLSAQSNTPGGGGIVTPSGAFQGDWDASGGTLPLTRTDSSPIEAGDSWRISVAGTITGLTPHPDLDPGDLLIARIDLATAAADFFSLQGNYDIDDLTIGFDINGKITVKGINLIIDDDDESIDGNDTPMVDAHTELVTRAYVDAAIGADKLFTRPGAGAAVPTLRPDGSAIQNGDMWEIISAGTIVGLEPHANVVPGDLLLARTDGASVVADFFAIQGNDPKQTEVVNLRVNTIAQVMALEPNLLDKVFVKDEAASYYYEESAAGEVVDGVNVLSTSLGGATRWIRLMRNTRIIKVDLIAGEPLRVDHTLQSANLHIDIYFEGEHTSDNIVGEVRPNELLLETVISGTYTIVLTKVMTDNVANTDYKIYTSTWTGLEITSARTMTQVGNFLSAFDTYGSIVVGESLYVITGWATQRLRRIDINTGADLGSVAIGTTHFKLNKDGTDVYVGGRGNQQLKVDCSGAIPVVISTLVIPDEPCATDPIRPWLGRPLDMECVDGIGYLLAGNRMREIDLPTHNFTGRSIVDLAYDSGSTNPHRYPEGSAVSQDRLYVSRYYSGESGASHECQIVMYDRFTLAELARTNIEHDPGTGNTAGGSIKPKIIGELVYVGVYFANCIQILDRRTLALVDRIDLPSRPRGLSTIGTMIYTNEYDAGILMEVDTLDPATIRTVITAAGAESNTAA